jgi:exopolysaccharide production protein ExoY
MRNHSSDVVDDSSDFSPKSMMPVFSSSSSIYKRFGKRLVDISFVLFTAPVVLPLTLFLALMLACRGISPFYRQPRVGRDGKVFTLIKLRTMVCDADAVLERHLADNPLARAEWERNQKLRHDPRITWAGTFLRTSSLDELPQFWNVLKGEMSLVGPRPMMVCQQHMYPGSSYYDMRPGISGAWQISKRNNSSFADRASYDQAYWHDMSLSTDASIMVRTVFVIIRGTGC